MYATSSGPRGANDAFPPNSSSLASRCNREIHSSFDSRRGANDWVDAARINSASASFTIDRRRSCSRVESKDEQPGTATAPAYKHPKKLATNSNPGGCGSNTRFPLAPTATSRAPMALAFRSSSAKVNDAASSSPFSRKRNTRLSGVSSARRRRTSIIVSFRCSNMTTYPREDDAGPTPSFSTGNIL